MNASATPMVRIIYNGVPYYIDSANHAYFYGIDQSGSRLHIGEYDPTTTRVILSSEWHDLYKSREPAFKASQATARVRNDPATKPQRTRKATVSKKATQASTIKI